MIWACLLEWQLPLVLRSNGWNLDFVVRCLILDDGEMFSRVCRSTFSCSMTRSLCEKVRVSAFSRDVGWPRVASFVVFSTVDYDLTIGLWGCALICVGPRECYPNIMLGFTFIAMSLLRNVSIFDC